jgi:hypothetical protein
VRIEQKICENLCQKIRESPSQQKSAKWVLEMFSRLLLYLLYLLMGRSSGCTWRGPSAEAHLAEAGPRHLDLLGRQCRAQAALIHSLRQGCGSAFISSGSGSNTDPGL